MRCKHVSILLPDQQKATPKKESPLTESQAASNQSDLSLFHSCLSRLLGAFNSPFMSLYLCVSSSATWPQRCKPPLTLVEFLVDCQWTERSEGEIYGFSLSVWVTFKETSFAGALRIAVSRWFPCGFPVVCLWLRVGLGRFAPLSDSFSLSLSSR